MSVSSPRFARNSRLTQAYENKPPMKQGEQGEAVAIVQDALIDLGYSMPVSTANGWNLADGVYGPETISVVRKFQTSFGLTADGIVGRQTLQKMSDLITALVAPKRRPSRLRWSFLVV
jgi:peptidoglycan hydrolase-like protein with peptidoglycan-binding domain